MTTRDHGRGLTPPVPVLAPDDVHVWRARLDRPSSARSLAPLLSPDERARAARFRFESDAVCFTVARACLRQILAAYLDADPGRLVFGYERNGKPFLIEPRGALTFNLSHSGDLALIGVAWNCRIGVDIERRRLIADSERLAEQVFATAERVQLQSVSAPARADAFLDGWTRKEAFIKALGTGLSCPLDTFVVSLMPGIPAKLISVHGWSSGAGHWSLHGLAAAPAYAAAIAIEKVVTPPVCRTWHG